MHTQRQQVKVPATPFFTSTPTGYLTRKCACGNHTLAVECGECSKKKRMSLQTNLKINEPGDIYEQEADRIAEQVLAAPAHPLVNGAALRIQRFSGQPSGKKDMAPSSVNHALVSPGQPLESALRQNMEQRFGHDFSHVRVHSGAIAEQSVRDVNATAYTVGNNIVFGAGQFAPGSLEGRCLIAHELTHVVQQSDNPTMLQRAENDTVSNCASLTDSQSDVDTKVNASLAGARAAAGAPPTGSAVVLSVVNDLGKNVQPGRSAIEVWASTLPPTKASLPAMSATKYAGVTYGLWSQPMFPILNPTMKINGICVGSDKLGHFFQQGATYLGTEASSGKAAAEEESERSEGGGFGLGTTGVFSNADQEANRQGGTFYKDLIASPTMTFSIAHYISPRWSEVDNPNFYEESVGHQVWANNLTGYWIGQSKNTPPSFDEILMLRLNGFPTGAVTGEFSIGGRNLGFITNGIIKYNTTKVKGENLITRSKTSLTPISNIHIDFDWTLDADSGKGFLDSSGERHLTGRWGTGASNTNRGAWDINHT